MSTSPPPINFQWIGNTLSYTLDPNVTGLQLKYKKDGDPNWTVIYDDLNSAPVTCELLSSAGPEGEIWGVTSKNSVDKWGPPNQQEITNQVV